MIDAEGTVITEAKVATAPREILSWIEYLVGSVERIVHESGPLLRSETDDGTVLVVEPFAPFVALRQLEI